MSNLKNNANTFWKNYSKKDLSQTSLMNLETNALESKKKFEVEKNRVSEVVNFSESALLVDLGGGIGLWSQYFSPKVGSVIMVENQKEFCNIARAQIIEDNITIVESDVIDFSMPENSCDYIFISGVTIYLDDSAFVKLLENVSKYLKPDGLFIHRDAYGTSGRFILNEKYSEKLESDYSAVYRTRKEYDEIFCERFNYVKEYDEDMYKINKDLNKWSETRLRLAIYKNKK